MHTFAYVKESKSEAKEIKKQENPHKNDREEIIPDGLMHEVPVGKGLSGALNLLRNQGSLKEINECSDRKRGTKTSKLGGTCDDQGQREIIIERRDEFGRSMNYREAFRQLCYKFHGKSPSRTKQEMRNRKIKREMKVYQSSNDHEQGTMSMDTILKAAQKPYLVINGNSNDVRNSFAAVAKCLPAGGK